MPRKKPAEAPPELVAPNPLNTRRSDVARPCRVLVVDDDELVRARLAALLQSSDFEVELAASGDDALRIMAATRCQILLTDWQMPEMDGLSLCRNVRDSHSEDYVYVLVHTIRDSQQDLLAGLAAGADDYIVKGAPVEELLARLEVGRRVSRRQSRRIATDAGGLGLIDPVTGAHDFSYLTKHLPRELARAKRYQHPLAILNCDVDGFTHINDRFGHEAGDELLRALVLRAGNCIRPESDWLARVAADEFVVVLPETKVHGANNVAQKLRGAFAQYPVASSAGNIGFTVSIGMAAIDPKLERDDKPELAELLRAAERGLCASKKRGGDQVTAAAVCSGVTIALGALMETSNDIH
jgi:two-component system, cell cycle response regulator